MGSFYRTQKARMGEYLSRHFCRWRDGRGPSNNNKTLVLDTLGGSLSGTRTSHKGGPAWGFCQNGSGQL